MKTGSEKMPTKQRRPKAQGTPPRGSPDFAPISRGIAWVGETGALVNLTTRNELRDRLISLQVHRATIAGELLQWIGQVQKLEDGLAEERDLRCTSTIRMAMETGKVALVQALEQNETAITETRDDVVEFVEAIERQRCTGDDEIADPRDPQYREPDPASDRTNEGGEHG